MKKKGYLFHLTFLLLDSADLAVSRVAERVKMGGHFVPDETIRRRFKAGLKDFFKLEVNNHVAWDNLVELYNTSS